MRSNGHCRCAAAGSNPLGCASGGSAGRGRHPPSSQLPYPPWHHEETGSSYRTTSTRGFWMPLRAEPGGRPARGDRRDAEESRVMQCSSIYGSRVQQTPGYCWPTPTCRNLCMHHAFIEGKKADAISPRKSTPRTLKWVGQQYPPVIYTHDEQANL
jgi:hypothetical protein